MFGPVDKGVLAPAKIASPWPRIFPKTSYDFNVQKDQRTFAQNLLHVAAADYNLMRSVSGSNVGPDFGKDAHNPSRDVYKTKADVVKPRSGS